MTLCIISQQVFTLMHFKCNLQFYNGSTSALSCPSKLRRLHHKRVKCSNHLLVTISWEEHRLLSGFLNTNMGNFVWAVRLHPYCQNIHNKVPYFCLFGICQFFSWFKICVRGLHILMLATLRTPLKPLQDCLSVKLICLSSVENPFSLLVKWYPLGERKARARKHTQVLTIKK